LWFLSGFPKQIVPGDSVVKLKSLLPVICGHDAKELIIAIITGQKIPWPKEKKIKT
jgi:hypothetical protein